MESTPRYTSPVSTFIANDNAAEGSPLISASPAPFLPGRAEYEFPVDESTETFRQVETGATLCAEGANDNIISFPSLILKVTLFRSAAGDACSWSGQKSISIYAGHEALHKTVRHISEQLINVLTMVPQDMPVDTVTVSVEWKCGARSFTTADNLSTPAPDDGPAISKLRAEINRMLVDKAHFLRLLPSFRPSGAA